MRQTVDRDLPDDEALDADRAGAAAPPVARAYDRMASFYDVLFGQMLEPGRRAMCEAARILNPGSLLEVGVGTGLTLEQYPVTTRVVGIDVSQDMLERARRRASAMPERSIELRWLDAERMPFADGSFDCVTIPYVLSTTKEPAQLVREVRRVCRKGGTILLVNHFSGSRFWWLMERAVRPLADQIGFRSEFRYDEQILCHDWEVVSVRPVNAMKLSRLVVLRN